MCHLPPSLSPAQQRGRALDVGGLQDQPLEPGDVLEWCQQSQSHAQGLPELPQREAQHCPLFGQDALRAKRNQEVADREWRRRELEKAQRKAEMEQKLKQDRLEQVAQKEQYLAMQMEQDRQEFQRLLR